MRIEMRRVKPELSRYQYTGANDGERWAYVVPESFLLSGADLPDFTLSALSAAVVFGRLNDLPSSALPFDCGRLRRSADARRSVDANDNSSPPVPFAPAVITPRMS